jgi:hypothetical protein
MKKTAFLINIARGELVDESALLNALKTSRISFRQFIFLTFSSRTLIWTATVSPNGKMAERLFGAEFMANSYILVLRTGHRDRRILRFYRWI